MEFDYGTTSWTIKTDCQSIKIISTHFDIRDRFDYLYIGDNSYTGNNSINDIDAVFCMLASIFTVLFRYR